MSGDETKDAQAVAEGADAREGADAEATPVATDDDQPAAASSGVWPVDRLKPVVEALVFAAGDPLSIRKMVDYVEGATADEVKATLDELATDCLTRGVRLIEVAGGWQMRTAPEHQRYVRKLFRERPQKLTRAATETIAIVAYRQPVTRQEIETVRGVDSGGVLESLVERKLAKVVGRKDVPGRPLVYATTQEFLELFGLKNIRELPTLPELGSDFERMSEQGGFSESERAAILPVEDEDGAQDDRAEDAGSGQTPEGDRHTQEDGAGGAESDEEGGDGEGSEGRRQH